ncbi:MAG: pyridoxal phosphate-dependent aminotransferase [Spirochaetes bacterium]|nr:pyridoxal phosphate-dependent aminotransferase [Spirochaetota bacterium]
MKKYNFNKIINRKNTCSIKWEGNKLFNKKENLIPLWVADMDFPIPKEVVREVKKRASHPIYGYTIRPNSYFETIINWFNINYNFKIQKEWIISTPGIVPAINFAIQAYTEPQDKIIIQTPVYYPFNDSIINNNRIPIHNSLIYKKLDKNKEENIINELKKRFINQNYKKKGELKLNLYSWFIDYDDLINKIDDKTKMIILCNPANPVGRVWTFEELKKLGEICLERNIIVLSDEIHCDLSMQNHKYVPFASISDEISNITITCTAASKTFNIAGLYNSNIIIKNEILKKKYLQVLLKNGLGAANLFGIIATEAAYRYGKDWLIQVKNYIFENYLYTIYTFSQNLPDAKITLLEGTFLVLIDFNPYKEKIIKIINKKFPNNLLEFEDFDKILKIFFEDLCNIWVDEGIKFGKEASGFMRINIATSRFILEKAYKNIFNLLS